MIAHRSHGLCLICDLPLPLDLAESPSADPVHVVRLPPGTPKGSTRAPFLRREVADQGWFYAHDGRLLHLCPALGVDEELAVRLLLGPAMGALLHQRGVVPLHGSAVRIGEFAVSIVGRAGAGKSTLAAALVTRGAELLADDVTAVSPDGAWVEPGRRRLRLRDDALEMLGLPREDGPILGGKRELAAPPGWPGRTRLVAVVVLAEGDGSESVLERLPVARGLSVLLGETFRSEYVLGAARATHLARCAQLASAVPAFRLVRSRTGRGLGEQARRIEGVMQGHLAGRTA